MKTLLLASLCLAVFGCAQLDKTVAGIQDHQVMKDACKALPLMTKCAEGMMVQMQATDPGMAKDLQSAITVVGVLQGVGCPVPVVVPAP